MGLSVSLTCGSTTSKENS